jgi:hypothetical protein
MMAEEFLQGALGRCYRGSSINARLSSTYPILAGATGRSKADPCWTKEGYMHMLLRRDGGVPSRQRKGAGLFG